LQLIRQISILYFQSIILSPPPRRLQEACLYPRSHGFCVWFDVPVPLYIPIPISTILTAYRTEMTGYDRQLYIDDDSGI